MKSKGRRWDGDVIGKRQSLRGELLSNVISGARKNKYSWFCVEPPKPSVAVPLKACQNLGEAVRLF